MDSHNAPSHAQPAIRAFRICVDRPDRYQTILGVVRRTANDPAIVDAPRGDRPPAHVGLWVAAGARARRRGSRIRGRWFGCSAELIPGQGCAP